MFFFFSFANCSSFDILSAQIATNIFVFASVYVFYYLVFLSTILTYALSPSLFISIYHPLVRNVFFTLLIKYIYSYRAVSFCVSVWLCLVTNCLVDKTNKNNCLRATIRAWSNTNSIGNIVKSKINGNLAYGGQIVV